MGLARLNFSHGRRSDHERNLNEIRRLSAKLKRPIGIIADLQGPKIRTGELAGKPLTLRKGGILIITTRPVRGKGNLISTTYKRLHKDVKAGDRILLDDGSMEVKVTEVKGSDIFCRVVYGGGLGAHKGMNLPGVKISAPPLTRKDREDVRFAVALGVDYFALSFVQRKGDVSRLRALLKKLKADTPIIAKIEKPEALENIDSIISEADGIMVARGDLGVEMLPEKVPQIQKDIIRRCIRDGKPVITATQMLESMIARPTPTRAEASDVANAIYDGTDAVMLSGETAIGSYPVKAVTVMAKIAAEADRYLIEDSGERNKRMSRRVENRNDMAFENAIGLAVMTTSGPLGAKLVVCFTSSGFTAQKISRYRPDAPIIAATQNPRILPRMSLYWGVEPIRVQNAETVDEMISNVERELLSRRIVRKGDNIIITAGYPLGVPGTTNMMQLVRVGEYGPSRGGKRGQR